MGLDACVKDIFHMVRGHVRSIWLGCNRVPNLGPCGVDVAGAPILDLFGVDVTDAPLLGPFGVDVTGAQALGCLG